MLKHSASENETQLLGATLAEKVFQMPKGFVQLRGMLGAGKSAFARGFIRRWCELAGDTIPETVVSPTYNIVKTYGSVRTLAHLDLYRLKSMTELENLGFEQYFYDADCCLVEWLEQISEALPLRPKYTIEVEIEFGAMPNERTFKIQD